MQNETNLQVSIRLAAAALEKAKLVVTTIRQTSDYKIYNAEARGNMPTDRGEEYTITDCMAERSEFGMIHRAAVEAVEATENVYDMIVWATNRLSMGLED